MIVLFLWILNDNLTSLYFSGDYNTESYYRDHSTKLTPLDPLQIEDSDSFFCAATILTINLYLIDEFQKRSKPWIAEVL